MDNLVITILTALVTAVVLPLITIIGKKLINLIETKISCEKAARHMTTAVNIVTDAVKSVTQTYVESLKKSGNFDEEAQAEALRRAKEIVGAQMGEEIKSHIGEVYGDFESWVKTQIEAAINSLKNSAQ